MNALRLFVALSILAVAAALASCGPQQQISLCNVPTLDEKGTDGGPDPCHCDPPASLNTTTCLCLSGDQQYVDAYNACMALYYLETDAGAEGGP